MIVREAERQKPPIYVSTHGGLWAFFGALIGAKVFWILQYDSPINLLYALLIWQGGLVYYGGLIGAVLALVIYFRINKLPHFRLGDVAIAYLPLGQAITRIGCFLNGCCWGRLASESVPWSICFPKNSHAHQDHVSQKLIEKAASHSLPVHPTQLYMVLGLLVILVILKFCLKRKTFDGAVLLLYCFFYGILRFIVEGFRGDSERSIFTLTVSQTISLALILFALTAFFAVRKFPIQIGPNVPETEPDINDAETNIDEEDTPDDDIVIDE